MRSSTAVLMIWLKGQTFEWVCVSVCGGLFFSFFQAVMHTTATAKGSLRVARSRVRPECYQFKPRKLL